MLARDATSGLFSLSDDTNVAQDGYLCFLDSSPKLPSTMLGNHVADRVMSLQMFEDTLNVLLIRAKVSKLSPEVSLDGALQLLLGNAEAGAMSDRDM